MTLPGAAPDRNTAPADGRIRRAVATDVDGVTALWIDLTLHHARLDPLFALRRGAEDEVRRIVGAQLRDPDRTAIFVAALLPEADTRSTLAGFCTVRVDAAPPIHPETQRAEITDLAVRAGARREGLGTALVDAAYAWLRGRSVERVEVRVASANAEGQAFWRARGFTDLMDVLHQRL